MPDSKPPIPDDAPPSYTATTSTTATTSNLNAPQQQTHSTSNGPHHQPPPRPVLDIPVLATLRHKRVILASASPRRRALLATLHLPRLEVRPSAFAEDLPKAGLSPFEYVLQTATQKALATYRAQLDHPAGDPDLIIAADTVVVARDGAILEKPRSQRHHVDMLRALRDGTPLPSGGGGGGGGGGASGLLGGGIGIEPDALVGAGIRGEGAVPGPVSAVGGGGAAHEQNGGGRDGGGGAWHRVFTAVAVLAPLASARDPGYVLETVVEETGVQFDGGATDAMVQAYVRTREGADKAGGYGIQGLGGLLVRKIDGAWDNVVGLPLRATLKLVERVVAAAEAEDGGQEDGEEEGGREG